MHRGATESLNNAFQRRPWRDETCDVPLEIVLKFGCVLIVLGPGTRSDDAELELSPSLKARLDNLLNTFRFALGSDDAGRS